MINKFMKKLSDNGIQYTKQIEVEIRGVFNEKKYKELKAFLNKNAVDLGQDDKEVYFFIMENKVVKAVHNTSQKSAKIVLKLARIGTSGNDAEEIEISISTSDFVKAVKFFSELEFNQIQRSVQTRRNYEYKGVIVSLKYSQEWGFHIELELLIKDSDLKVEAERKLMETAEELGVKIMSQSELKEFTDSIDKKSNFKHTH